MKYASAVMKSRRSVLITGAGIGTLFSVISAVTFGKIGPLEIAVSAIWGAVEGLIISGSGITIQSLLPEWAEKRYQRMLLEFAMGSAIHAVLALILMLVSGMQVFFLALFIGLLSMVAGELVCAREPSVISREDETLAMEGKTRLPPGAADYFSLSPRETEVAELLLARASYQEICARLFISLPTVKSHVSAIYRKTDASSRREFISAMQKMA